MSPRRDVCAGVVPDDRQLAEWGIDRDAGKVLAGAAVEPGDHGGIED
jgi:hypothetical protein